MFCKMVSPPGGRGRVLLGPAGPERAAKLTEAVRAMLGPRWDAVARPIPEVTPETLAGAHLLRDTRIPIKVLGRGELKVALKVHVHRVSASAKAKILAAGGTVETIQ